MRGTNWCVIVVVLVVACAPAPEDHAHLEGPIDGLSDEQVHIFTIGDDTFDHVYTPEEGLGPRFNQASCNTCHPDDAAGSPNTRFLRFGRMVGDRFDAMVAYGGPQLKDKAVPGFEPDRLPDGDDVAVSGFMALPVTGLGLLEAVPLDTLLEMSDPDDVDGDGIRGRVQWLVATEQTRAIAARENDMLPESNRIQLYQNPAPGLEGDYYIGRFGRKAASISILHQVANALHDDMGLTNPYHPLNSQSPKDAGFPVSSALGDDNHESDLPGASVEVQMPTFNALVFYMKTLRPPARRHEDDPVVRRGEDLFDTIGCTHCHKSRLTTGDSPIAPLRNVTFHPYTDLLLHDLGDALDDGYTEGTAKTGEWRTTPLWGIGLRRNAQGGALYLLHDGRATSWREAVDYHGGEAAGVRARFQALPEEDARAIEAFLESL